MLRETPVRAGRNGSAGGYSPEAEVRRIVPQMVIDEVNRAHSLGDSLYDARIRMEAALGAERELAQLLNRARSAFDSALDDAVLDLETEAATTGEGPLGGIKAKTSDTYKNAVRALRSALPREDDQIKFLADELKRAEQAHFSAKLEYDKASQYHKDLRSLVELQTSVLRAVA